MPYTVREPAQGVVNYTVQGPGGQWNWLDGSGWFQNGTFKVTYPTTSAQLTLEYDNADNLQVNVSSAGAVTYTAAGSAPSHTFSGGALTLNGPLNITASAATAFTVSGDGTHYGLQVDESVASAVTGLKITAQAAGSGVGIAAISSAANDLFAINAKGSGQIYIANESTGAVNVGQEIISSSGTVGGLSTQYNSGTLGANPFHFRLANAAGTGRFLIRLDDASGANNQDLAIDRFDGAQWDNWLTVLRSSGTATMQGSLTVATGLDSNTSLSIGAGGTSTANRSVPLVLNVPSSGSFPGIAETRYQRNGANVWTTGVDSSSSQTHLLNTDLYFNSFLSGVPSYVATISGTGGFTTLNGITTLNGNIQAAGNVVATAGSLFSGADPTGVTGQFAIGATATVGNGGTASLIAATKSTGGGPASMTVLTWVHAAIGSSPCWIPLFA